MNYLTFTSWRNVTLVTSLNCRRWLEITGWTRLYTPHTSVFVVPIRWTPISWFEASACPRVAHNRAAYIYCVQYDALILHQHAPQTTLNVFMCLEKLRQIRYIIDRLTVTMKDYTTATNITQFW